MQTRSDQFRAQAAECQELADRSYELIKEQYQLLARQWLFLAEHAKAYEVLSQFAVAWRNVNFLPTGRRLSSFASLPFTRVEL
jgi:hypothetical protein